MTPHGNPPWPPTAQPARPVVCLTVDAEPDCPPYLEGWRGMEEGAPILLEIFASEGVPATFFVTGETAVRHPAFVSRLVADGHELASHGMTHRPFPTLTVAEARAEIRDTSAILRTYAPVTAFRAPNLRMPDAHLPLLEEDGYRVDASLGKYKPAHWHAPASTKLRRLPASVTSAWLRLPPWMRDPMLGALASPVVLFVHPWEFVDMRGEPVPWDCRAGTGAHALHSLREVIGFFRQRRARFARVTETALGGAGAQPPPTDFS